MHRSRSSAALHAERRLRAKCRCDRITYPPPSFHYLAGPVSRERQRGYAPVIAACPEISIRRGRPDDIDWPSAFAALVADESRSIRAAWPAERRPYVAPPAPCCTMSTTRRWLSPGPYLVGLVPDLQPIRVASGPLRAGLADVGGRAAGARRSPTALWRLAADAPAGTLRRPGEQLRDERTGRSRRPSCSATPAGPAVRRPAAVAARGASFREVTQPDGTRLITRERNECCLAYTLGGTVPCVGCPRAPGAKRLEPVPPAERGSAGEGKPGRDLVDVTGERDVPLRDTAGAVRR